MTAGRGIPGARRGPARHERPVIDEAALVAARAGDRMLAAVREVGSARWTAYLEPIPDRLRDDEIVDLRRTALRARSAFGPKDSIRDVLPASLTEPFLDAVDVEMGVMPREQVVALELGKADVIEIVPSDARRISQGALRTSATW